MSTGLHNIHSTAYRRLTIRQLWQTTVTARRVDPLTCNNLHGLSTEAEHSLYRRRGVRQMREGPL